VIKAKDANINDVFKNQRFLMFKMKKTRELMEKEMDDEFQWGLRKAKNKGLRIIEPKANELQIDLDGIRAIHTYGLQYWILERGGLTKGWKGRMSVSRSNKKTHVHITITMPKNIDHFQRIALQAILGSDLRREAFNICRVTRGNKYPIVFFEKEK